MIKHSSVLITVVAVFSYQGCFSLNLFFTEFRHFRVGLSVIRTSIRIRLPSLSLWLLSLRHPVSNWPRTDWSAIVVSDLAKGDRKTDDKPYNPSKRLREILVELIQCAMLGQSKKGKFKHTET